jgi:diacylglycerol kinase family enzyme
LPRSRRWSSSKTASPPPPRSGPSRSRHSSARSASSPSRPRNPLLRRFLVINPRSGGVGPSAEHLEEKARARRIVTRILGPDDDSAQLARDADAEALGVAGGDGSLGPVAEVAIERNLPFVVIPFGTRNHFARDLGLDRTDPIRALSAFSGSERRIDVGRVGDRLFLNNVSLGLYAALVHRRARHRQRREALAQLRALLLLARNPSDSGLSVDGTPVSARVALVANNHYALELFSLGERERLDEGRLHLYLAAGWRPSEWHEQPYERLTIDAVVDTIQAAVDGEPVTLRTPVEFMIEPRALRVLVPEPS